MSQEIIAKSEAVASTDIAPNSVVKVYLSICPQQVPPLTTGECSYYNDRNESFLQRHDRQKTPPTYYLNYGFKYCSKFKAETYSKLSEEGKMWLDNVLSDLQKLMEKGVVERAFVSVNNDAYNGRYLLTSDTVKKQIDGKMVTETIASERTKEFYKGIECREDEFKDFAFATHPDAYNPKEMEKLPVTDLIKIAWTPDLKEWLDGRTWEQALIMYDNMDVSQITSRTTSEFMQSITDSINRSVARAKDVLQRVFK
jgi:DNA-binding Lrp family transcriptional regulator